MGLKPVMVAAPALLALLIGWVFFIVYFGKYHYVYAKNMKYDPSSDSDKASRYVISFMHMWIFALGVPVAVGLAVFHRLMSSEILGVLETIAEAICAATIGAALPNLTFGLYQFAGLYDGKGYIVVGFLGSMISVIALVALLGVVPYVVKKFAPSDGHGTHERLFNSA